MRREANVSELMGKIIIDITKAKKGDETIRFHCSDGTKYEMMHNNDSYESVYIEDIAGDLDALLNSPILMAEEETNNDEGGQPKEAIECSYTWTYYKFATIKGYVTIRWYGESNGYYSEEVDFEQIL